MQLWTGTDLSMEEQMSCSIPPATMDSSSATDNLLRAAAQGNESLVMSLMQQGADALYQACHLRDSALQCCHTYICSIMRVTATIVCMHAH